MLPVAQQQASPPQRCGGDASISVSASYRLTERISDDRVNHRIATGESHPGVKTFPENGIRARNLAERSRCNDPTAQLIPGCGPLGRNQQRQ
jgi:hypothetical protein